MPTWDVKINGTVYEVEAPSIRAAITEAKRRRAVPMPRGATAGMLPTSTGQVKSEATAIDETDVRPDIAFRSLLDPFIGMAKGAGQTAVGLGEMMQRVPGVASVVDALYDDPGISARAFGAGQARRVIEPSTPEQRLGSTVEQMGEFFLPTGATGHGAKYLTEVAKSGTLTAAQGGSAGDAAVSAGVSALVPGAGGWRRAGAAIKAKANPLVQAAIKPAMASLRRVTGQGGLDAKAKQLVQFIIDRRLTTPEQAMALFQRTEEALQRVLSVRHAPTDEPARVLRYLNALEQSAARQRLPAQDVAAIRNAAAELVEGSLGRDVITMVPRPHPTLLGPNGQPITVLVPQTTRAMRATTPADEALQAARASGRWSTRKAWGELKGTDKEILKTVERAGRDAIKTAIPATRPLLRTEASALQAKEVLDRMTIRTGNRDAASLPAHVIAAGELASGRVPVLAFAANWLRNNQMKAGIWADRLGKAINTGNAPLAADILKRLGVGGVSQALSASE